MWYPKISRPLLIFNLLSAFSACLISIFFAGCRYESSNSVLLKAGADINMQLPFQPSRNWMGWIDSTPNASGAFYFADLTTHKKIFFTNEAGHLIDSIPLTVSPRWHDRLKGLIVYSRDTVLAASEYHNNHLYYFNHDGYVFRDVSLQVTFHDTLYEAMGNGMVQSGKGDQLFLANNLIGNPAFADTTLPESEYLRRYDKVWNAMPVAIRYEGAGMHDPAVAFVGVGLRERYTPDGSFSLSSVQCATASAYYMATENADSIYKFSLGPVPVLQKVAAVHSALASSKTLAYVRSTKPVDGKAVTDKEASYRCLRYDRYRHYIYLTAYHPAPPDARPQESGEHRKWSLFVYDEALNKLAEFGFEKDTYDPNDFIVSPKGLLLRKTDHDHAHKTLFTLFEVAPKS